LALIDSSIIIAAERGRLDLEAQLGARLGEWLGVAAVTVSELYAGVLAPGRPELKRRASEAVIDKILASMEIVPFDAAIARIHAGLYAELRAKGATVGLHDLQIAATAIARGQLVATRDLRSFPRIPGLKYEEW